METTYTFIDSAERDEHIEALINSGMKTESDVWSNGKRVQTFKGTFGISALTAVYNNLTVTFEAK